MTEVLYRKYGTADIPALVSLWADIFGDSPETVSCFFDVLPETGSCFVAECGGRLCGMASVLTDLTLKSGNSIVKCAYIYAVAVEPSFRGAGLGGTLSRLAADYGKNQGAAIIATLPANEGLYSMYAKTCGLDKVLKREKTSAAASDASGTFPMRSASPGEYNRKREELLASVPHVSVSDRSMMFFKKLCTENGGDLFLSGSSCAALYRNDDAVFFPELLCPEEDRSALLSSGAALGNAGSAYCYIPSETGARSIAYAGQLVYHNPVWNITFE